jgi:hypothetical protein
LIGFLVYKSKNTPVATNMQEIETTSLTANIDKLL